MRSLVHLFNTALAQLGGDQIPLNISPLEDDAAGAICQALFPHVLDTVLEAHVWAFAMKRVALALVPEQEPDSHAFRFRYGLPTDSVRPVRVVVPERRVAVPTSAVNRSPSYAIEGIHILCDVEEAELLYVSRVEEPKRWPAYFADVLVWKLAAGLATARNNDLRQKQMCEQEYERALAKGCAMDKAMQNPRRPVSSWQVARGNRGERLTLARGW